MLLQILHDVRARIPGCISTSVVSLRDGLSIATSSVDTLKASGSDAFHSNIYGLVSTMLQEGGTGGDARSVVIESEHLTLVSGLVGDSGYFWHVVTDRESTLGYTQAMMRKHQSSVASALQELIE